MHFILTISGCEQGEGLGPGVQFQEELGRNSPGRVGRILEFKQYGEEKRGWGAKADWVKASTNMRRNSNLQLPTAWAFDSTSSRQDHGDP